MVAGIIQKYKEYKKFKEFFIHFKLFIPLIPFKHQSDDRKKTVFHVENTAVISFLLSNVAV
ncbi:MAG: hypothetical protein BGO54_07320 [Sphingobacteriales bacterium 46-32]|jgi:hypothetical protein|nr:MAG: hypothetical protein BGO54_07320 [Sphingobacteriales bacterium 46-32]